MGAGTSYSQILRAFYETIWVVSSRPQHPIAWLAENAAHFSSFVVMVGIPMTFLITRMHHRPNRNRFLP